MSLVRLNRQVSSEMLASESSPTKQQRSNSPKSALANKLAQLEKKQYELTKQVNYLKV